MPARTIATMVTTGNIKIKMPVPNIPMPLVEAKAKANAVQVNMASAVSIEVRRVTVLLPSLASSATSRLRLVQ
jgi:hypothetical protein